MYELIFLIYFLSIEKTVEIPVDYTFETESACYIASHIAFNEKFIYNKGETGKMVLKQLDIPNTTSLVLKKITYTCGKEEIQIYPPK